MQISGRRKVNDYGFDFMEHNSITHSNEKIAFNLYCQGRVPGLKYWMVNHLREKHCMLFWASFVKQVSWKSFTLLIKTAPVLLLCNWISGGQECLDDHPRQLFQYCLLFWASFVKQVSWKSLILLIKTAPVLLLYNWISGEQEGLDDHPCHSSYVLGLKRTILRSSWVRWPNMNLKLIKLYTVSPTPKLIIFLRSRTLQRKLAIEM